MRTRLYLTHADHGRALSWDEFVAADAEEGYRYEMIEGRVFVSPAAEYAARGLREVARATARSPTPGTPRHPLLRPSAPCVFLPDRRRRRSRPPSRTSRVTRSSPPTPSPRSVDWRDYSPVLVIEVISPDTADKDLVRNRRLYLQVPGIKEYWILDPREGVEGLTLLVYRRRGRRWEACRTVAAGATYATPLLPGFSLLLDPLA